MVIDESRTQVGEICAGLAVSEYQVAAILAGSDNLTAKGGLMKARGLDEDAAYHAMRKRTTEPSQPLVNLAHDIIDMARSLRLSTHSAYVRTDLELFSDIR